MFWIRGIIGGVIQKVCYEESDGHGSLTGDEGILFLMNMEFEERSIVGPVGQYMEANVDNPLSVLFVAKKCFDKIMEAGGDLPEADEIPEGCIC